MCVLSASDVQASRMAEVLGWELGIRDNPRPSLPSCPLSPSLVQWVSEACRGGSYESISL